MSSSRWRHEWIKILEFVIAFGVIPTILFFLLGRRWPGALVVCYYVIVTAFVMQAAMSYVCSIAALPRRRFHSPTGSGDLPVPPVPRTTFIVSAYLPNEVGVIEETLNHILRNVVRPAAGIEVMLAYNTPQMEPIEARLRELAAEWPELILANAYNSRGKAENQNYALEMASGQIIALLDADHIVAPDCLERAWRWLYRDVDVVQGRCKVRNGGLSLVSSLVEVEFEVIYGINHQAKSLIFDSALFGGSDAYWRAPVLKEIGFDKSMVTEDIDATLRTLLKGHRIVHDRSIVSRELAPEKWGGWWFQRKRWAQGWFQCTVKHQGDVLRSKALSYPAKFIWTWLLAWRVIYDVIANLLFPIVLAHWLLLGRVSLPMTPFIWFAVVFTLLSGPVEGIVAYVRAVLPRFPPGRLLLYALAAFPYTLLKNVVQMIAIRDDLLGQKDWIVSSRK